MGGFYANISLRMDEREAIAKYMADHKMRQHEVLKLAIRQFFWPNARTIPLNGREVHVEEVPTETAKTITVEPSEEDEDVFAGLIDKNE